MANQNVTSTIDLKGEDGASASINSAKASVEKLGAATAGADQKASALGESAKKVAPIFSGLGGIAAEQLGKAGQVAQVFGATLSTVPGPMGLIAAGAAAIGAAMFAIYNQEKEITAARFKGYRDQVDALQAHKAALADSLHLHRELLGAVQGEGTVQERATASTERRAVALKAASEAWEAGDRKRAAAAEAVVVNENRILDTLNIEFGIQQKLAATELARATKVAQVKDLRDAKDAQRDQAINEIQDKREQHEARIAENASKRKRLEQDIAESQANSHVFDPDKQKRQIEFSAADLSLRKELTGILAQGDAIHAETLSKKKAAVELTKAQKAAQLELSMAIRDELKANIEGLAAKKAALLAADQAQADSALKIAQARAVSAAGDPAAQARLEIIAVEMEAEQAQENARNQFATNEVMRNNAITLAKVSADAKIQGVQKREYDRMTANHTKDVQLQQERSAGYVSMAKSGVDALGALGVGERALAGIKAGISVAEGLLAFARGDYAGAAAGAAAAIAFGAQALGAGASASAPSGASSSASAQRATAGGSGSNVTNTTVILQGGAYVGTMQGVGKALQGAIGSLANTGLKPSMGV